MKLGFRCLFRSGTAAFDIGDPPADADRFLGEHRPGGLSTIPGHNRGFIQGCCCILSFIESFFQGIDSRNQGVQQSLVAHIGVAAFFDAFDRGSEHGNHVSSLDFRFRPEGHAGPKK